MEKRLVPKLLPEIYHIFNLVMCSIKKKSLLVFGLSQSYLKVLQIIQNVVMLFFFKETYILMNLYTYYIRVLLSK